MTRSHHLSLEAALWRIAERLGELLSDDMREMVASQRELTGALNNGDLQAEGQLVSENNSNPGYQPIETGWWVRYVTKGARVVDRSGVTEPEQVTIVDWNHSAIWWWERFDTKGQGFREIRINAADLDRIWPIPEMPAEEPSGYVAPYVELLHKAIQYHEITAQRQPKVTMLKEWFLHQNTPERPISNRIAEVMATLVRLPERRKGGYIK